MTVHAPYNFVPLSAKVVRVPWADRISHDVPFCDGISGWLDVDLVARTPLCVGGVHENQRVQPFSTPDGKSAIPGTSVKGMLRNVLEIATFGKFQFVDWDRPYAVRDLTGGGRAIYGIHMSDGKKMEGGKTAFFPKTRPGWLRVNGEGEWEIQPCRVCRIEQEELLTFLAAGAGGEEARRSLEQCFTSGRQDDGRLPRKYEAWLKAGTPLEVEFTPEESATAHASPGKAPKGLNKYLLFNQASKLGKGTHAGQLVLTGQGSPNKRLVGKGNHGFAPSGKHREFIFYEYEESKRPRPIPVSRELRDGFEIIHSNTQGERHQGLDQPNPEWEYLRPWLKEKAKGKRVPVFYLFREGTSELRCFGLTQMFRLAYDHTVGDTIAHASIDHHPDPGKKCTGAETPVDFAEAIFGYVRSHKSGGAGLAGRASVGLFRLVDGGDLVPEQAGVLGSPKPTYYPCYMDQEPVRDGLEHRVRVNRGIKYQTLMQPEAEPRGWKRYPVGLETRVSSPGEAAVTTTWQGLGAGSRFRGRIRFHNLRPMELGAILWCLDFGKRPEQQVEHLHSLGYARPFGYGAVSLAVTASEVRSLAGGEPWSLQNLVQEFVNHMEDELEESGGWMESPQLFQLRAMADPAKAAGHNLQYMTLGDLPAQNEFSGAKRTGELLPPYVDLPVEIKSDRERFPRRWTAEQQWLERAAEGKTREKERLRAKEEARREALGVRGRLREDLRDILASPVGEQVEWLLARAREALPREEPDARVWKSELATAFAQAVQEIELRLDSEADPIELPDEPDFSGLGPKPKNRRSKPFKRWRKKKEAIEKRHAELKVRLASTAREAMENQARWQALLDWIRDVGNTG